jgi:hypothetical protein
MPIETRKASESSATEGLCHQCNGWIVFTTKRQDANEQNPIPTLWFKVGFFVLRTPTMASDQDVLSSS